MTTEYMWVRNNNNWKLYARATEGLTGTKFSGKIGEIHYDSDEHNYVFNQRVFMRNINKECLQEVVNKLEELDKKEDAE